MTRTAYTLSAALLIAGAVWAQDPQAGWPPPGGPLPPPPGGQSPPFPGQPRAPMDPMAQYLYPPDLVMRNAEEIDLSEGQRKALQEEMERTQGQLPDLHKKLQAEMESLVHMIKQEKVDEEEARAQFDKALSAENKIKKAQFDLMLRIKNHLTGPQQGQLREMRRQMMMNPRGQAFGGPGEGPRPGGPDGRQPRPNRPNLGGEPPRPPLGE